jgi:hypothetical protein
MLGVAFLYLVTGSSNDSAAVPTAMARRRIGCLRRRDDKLDQHYRNVGLRLSLRTMFSSGYHA